MIGINKGRRITRGMKRGGTKQGREITSEGNKKGKEMTGDGNVEGYF